VGKVGKRDMPVRQVRREKTKKEAEEKDIDHVDTVMPNKAFSTGRGTRRVRGQAQRERGLLSKRSLSIQ